jgi:hypothetical protein
MLLEESGAGSGVRIYLLKYANFYVKLVGCRYWSEDVCPSRSGKMTPMWPDPDPHSSARNLCRWNMTIGGQTLRVSVLFCRCCRDTLSRATCSRLRPAICRWRSVPHMELCCLNISHHEIDIFVEHVLCCCLVVKKLSCMVLFPSCNLLYLQKADYDLKTSSDSCPWVLRVPCLQYERFWWRQLGPIRHRASCREPLL